MKIHTISSNKPNSTGTKQKTSLIQHERNETSSSDVEDSGSVRLTGMDVVSYWEVVDEVYYSVLISQSTNYANHLNYP